MRVFQKAIVMLIVLLHFTLDGSRADEYVSPPDVLHFAKKPRTALGIATNCKYAFVNNILGNPAFFQDIKLENFSGTSKIQWLHSSEKDKEARLSFIDTPLKLHIGGARRTTQYSIINNEYYVVIDFGVHYDVDFNIDRVQRIFGPPSEVAPIPQSSVILMAKREPSTYDTGSHPLGLKTASFESWVGNGARAPLSS